MDNNTKKEFVREIMESRHCSAGDLSEVTSAGDDVLLAKELEMLDKVD